jgi:DMSO reductase anchor subunit
MPLQYKKNEQGKYEPQVAEKSVSGQKAKVEWNLKKVSTRENPLVVFTLISQAVVGAFILLFIGPMFGLEMLSPEKNPIAWPMFLFGLIGIQTLALVLSTMHLGKPHRFYRAFNNLKYSPVSREVAGIAVFYNFIGAFTLLTGLPQLFYWLPESLLQTFVSITGWGAVVSGLAAIFFMHKIYRIPARPFWDHWQVFSSFYGSVLSLGSLLLALVYGSIQVVNGESWAHVIPTTAAIVFIGLLMEVVGLYFHQKDLMQQGGEGAAAHFEQKTKFGKTYTSRNMGLFAGLFLTAVIFVIDFDGLPALFLLVSTAVIIVLSSVVGRALFYALVMPTTMPGAFFWRNKNFQEHARETGLANMPQVGVLPELH